MNNLNKLCIDFSEQIFSLCLALEKNQFNSSSYSVNQILKEILIGSKNLFFLSVKAEKCETNLEYLESLEASINQNQEIMYWFSLLYKQKLIAQEDYEKLERSAEEIEFIADLTIKKVHEHIENVMNGFYE